MVLDLLCADWLSAFARRANYLFRQTEITKNKKKKKSENNKAHIHASPNIASTLRSALRHTRYTWHVGERKAEPKLNDFRQQHRRTMLNRR